jgi:hypothetical protein
LNEHLDYNVTASVLTGAAGRALGAVISKFKCIKNVGFRTFSKLYHASVTTVMDYCSAVWGYKELDCCTKLQQRACRYYLGVHQWAPLLAVEAEIGWPKCRVRRFIEMARLWNRLVKMNNSRLTKIMFLWDHSLCHNNWSSELKLLLYSMEMQHVFDHKETIDIVLLLKKCLEIQEYEWLSALPTKPKLRTYMKFKNTFTPEDYVQYCPSRRQRSLLAQLRLGILPLNIEIGRYRNKKVEERICEICNVNQIEDEIYLLCQCNAYTQLRNEMYSDVNNIIADMDVNEKFIYLMQCK